MIDAIRWLTDAQRAALPAGDDVDGFATRAPYQARGQGGSASLMVPASRRRSLVISEWAFNTLSQTGLGAYFFGGFLELFNNADTTVYLDGLLVGEGFFIANDYPNSPCALYTQYTDDPLGVWGRFMEQFPGSGREHPLAPGQTVVIATDAIDHRPLFPGGIDLSHADFEMTGPADVDNPAVPNMVDVGLYSHTDGHGLYWVGDGRVVIVALPVDVPTLYREAFPPPNASATYARIPKERLLDVLWIRPNYPGAAYPECPRLVNSAFDRAGADMRGTDEFTEGEWSLSRRMLASPIAGRTVLQHTRSGRADFVRTRRTPGLIGN